MPLFSSDLYVGELMMRIVGRQTGEISKVEYRPQKPPFPESSAVREVPLARSTPEEQGVSSAYIETLFNALNQAPNANMHRIMVMRHGVVIGETAFAPFDLDHWHVTHSMCKSVTSMAIGILVGEGRLKITDKVLDLLPARKTVRAILRLRDLTVEHLLTMTSGVQFNETGAVSGNDWIKGYMDSTVSFSPGTQFDYNSMNSYMLSAIVSEITGMSLFDFVSARIFEPLGIKRAFWESDPQHITKGGWGLFLRIEDMCKLGQLYLQKGAWNGRQIVPAEWVEVSTAFHVATDVEDAPGYGYQIWCLPDREGAYDYNGMLGQNVYMYPDIDMVIAVNAGNAEVFQQGEMSAVISKWIREIETQPQALPANENAYRRLLATCRAFGERKNDFPVILRGGWKRRSLMQTNYVDIMNRLHLLMGHHYDFGNSGIGIFPLLMQVMHNNFTDGITRIGFTLIDRQSFGLEIYEGDQIYTLPCGLDMYRNRVAINMHGEIYNAVVRTKITTDEYGRMVILLRIMYLEEATERRINIFLGSKYDSNDTAGIHAANVPDGIDVHFSEYPGNDLISKTLKSVTVSKGFEGMLMSKLSENGATNVLDTTIHYTISPRIHGILADD